MFSAIARIFRTPDLRRKIGFTLAHHRPVPARLASSRRRSSTSATCRPVSRRASGHRGAATTLVNLFSGGALLQLSIFALGIMPYITASIIVQLLRVVIPHFETLYKEGQAGQARLTQYTRYLTIALGAAAVDDAHHRRPQRCAVRHRPASPSASSSSPTTPGGRILLMVITMTAGTGLIMWFGELITERGIGNGMSLLIFTSIAATFPGSLWAIGSRKGFEVFLLVLAVGIVVVVARRLRRAVAAAHPGAVRQAHGRPPHLRRQQHLHPDQGQHGRRRARHLRLVAAVPARAHRAVQPAAGGRDAAAVGRLDHELPHQGRPPALHARCTSCSSSASRTSTSRSRSTPTRSPTT